VGSEAHESFVYSISIFNMQYLRKQQNIWLQNMAYFNKVRVTTISSVVSVHLTEQQITSYIWLFTSASAVWELSKKGDKLSAMIHLESEACATRLCSHTFSVDFNPETSMALTYAVVGAFSAPDVSANESSYFHMHGSHF